MRLALLLALCAALLPGWAGAQENPVTNGGFEQLDAGGFPLDWGAVSEFAKVTGEAHSGQRAMRFERGPGAPPEVGLNRAWTPQSGEQGKMLAETKGGLIFWYQVVSASPTAELSIQVIPMNDRAWEDTGEQRLICRLSRDLAGDGQWHEGRLVYDFSTTPKVKWVHVGIRLTGGPATLLVDDVQYVTQAGPILKFEKLHLYPDASAPDKGGVLTASITNAGDAPTAPLQVRLRLPDGLTAPDAAPVAALPAAGAQVVKWHLTGALRAGTVTLEADAGAARVEATFRLAPRVEALSLLAGPSLAAPGGETTVALTLWNRGTAMAEGLTAVLSAPKGLAVVDGARHEAPAIAPGRRGTVRWRVRLPRAAGEYGLRCALEGASAPLAPPKAGAPGVPEPGTAATVVVTDAVAGPAEAATLLLRVRRGTDRSLGELVLSGKPERLLARLPHLGRVILRLPDGREQTLTARYGAARRSGAESVFESTVRDRAGATWRFRATARALSPQATRLGIRVVCDQPRKVLLFEGPMLLAGEGSTGDAKREALFPGLEWLAPDEVSSSDLDIAAEHPDRQRYLPHPHKVTIPAMGVQTARGVVGLLWDVHQRWDGKRDMPQPLFSVPDRLTGAAAHRMGLVAPNVPAGLPENRLRARPGLALAAGRPLELSGVLYADPAGKDALAAMDAWFRYFKPDPILLAPRGSDLAQVAWSMRGYMKSLWASPEEGWMPFLGGPGIWRKPAFAHAFAYDLEQGARLLTGRPEAREWLARVEEVRPKIGHAQADDLGFAGPRTLTHFGNVAVGAYRNMVDQGEERAWRFDADRRDEGVFKGLDYHELGADGAVELGTIARAAYEILLYARMSGDRQAYQAGVDALERMAKFTIPRAAQVWEVPVHSPDILAAADACEAYLEAYRCTKRDGKPGDARWLREARRWARAGLPFVYVWNAPGKPWMRYGSIPVFGASWWQCSWFGNIVQWNGLRHAYALLKLHECDPQARWGGLSWRDLAVGITRSAMYQQSTKPETLGLWPDSLHTVTGGRANWEFPPRLILKNVWVLLGRIEEPRTRVVAGPGGEIRVSASARIEAAEWKEGGVHIRLRRNPGESGSVLLAGATLPSAVRVDGAPVARGEYGGDSGWQYDQARALLAVPANATAPEIVVEGIRATPVGGVGGVVEGIAFEFGKDTEGWLSANHLEPLATEGGALVARADGVDPYMHRYLCRIAGDRVREVVLRVRGTGDGGGQFYWVTKLSPAFDEAKDIRFQFPTDGEWHEVVVPVGDHPLWRGQTITALRIDPGSTPGSVVSFDWIRGR